MSQAELKVPKYTVMLTSLLTFLARCAMVCNTPFSVRYREGSVKEGNLFNGCCGGTICRFLGGEEITTVGTRRLDAVPPYTAAILRFFGKICTSPEPPRDWALVTIEGGWFLLCGLFIQDLKMDTINTHSLGSLTGTSNPSCGNSSCSSRPSTDWWLTSIGAIFSTDELATLSSLLLL